MKKIQNTEQASALKKGDAIVYLSKGIEQEFQITMIDDLAVFATSKNELY
jgi:2-C-methyl-D-erythritol 4-phosphate cytidylyltransferase